MKIKHININLYNKEFSYYTGCDDVKTKKEKKIYNKDLEEFKNNNVISHEENTSTSYQFTNTIYYYTGFVEFLPVKEGGSSIKTNKSFSE